MVRAWYMDDSDAKKEETHIPENADFIDLDTLYKTCGAHYWKLDADNYEKEGKLAKIREERSYNYEDCVDLPKGIPDYEHTKDAEFFREHIHADDETRFVTDGSGYFDLRDPHNDKWIRVEVDKGDMISVPAGVYHRFTMDTKNYIKANRYFSGAPVWTPVHRPCDDHPVRVAYLKKMGCA